MMNLFDRVLTSMSVATLVALTAVTLGLMVSLGFLEAIRSRALTRMGGRFDEVAGEKVFDAIVRANLQQRVGGATLSQVDQVRAFLSGTALSTFFDLPFVPIFLFVLYLLHWWLGVFALCACVVLFILGMSIEWFCKPKLRESAKDAARAASFAHSAAYNAEVVAALGMIGNLRDRWRQDHNKVVDFQTEVSDRIGDINGVLKASTYIVQICMLGLACYLVIRGDATPGTMFAANVLAMRIVAPVQLSVSAWRSLTDAREALSNLDSLLATVPEQSDRLRLPAPSGKLTANHVYYSADTEHGKVAILKGVSFSVPAGSSLGIIGPSGSGKTTLVRMLVGIIRPERGHVRLDGADIASWDFDDLGPYLGYLPQDVELFNGTVAQNISRFGDQDAAAIVEAASLAGVHEMVLKLPDGYDTEIRQRGGALSGGQRQRVALARALYGNPRMVVLDEPNSNLDSEGESVLLEAIDRLREKGTTVILVAHNPRILQGMDKILVLRAGKVESKGDRGEVLSRLQLVVGGASRTDNRVADTSA
jgi:PrtD family type I secretion system ABC transporter